MERLQKALQYAEKRKAERHTRRAPGIVYLYLIACHDFVKVGVALDPKARLIQLQVGCPYELKLLAQWPSDHAAADEARLHELWKRFEVRGEWFLVPAGEIACVLNANTLEAIFQG
jgi:hypothetical protein